VLFRIDTRFRRTAVCLLASTWLILYASNPTCHAVVDAEIVLEKHEAKKIF